MIDWQGAVHVRAKRYVGGADEVSTFIRERLALCDSEKWEDGLALSRGYPVRIALVTRSPRRSSGPNL